MTVGAATRALVIAGALVLRLQGRPFAAAEATPLTPDLIEAKSIDA